MQRVHEAFPLLGGKEAKLGREYLLDLSFRAGIPPLPLVLQLVGERLMYPGRPPSGGHFLKDARSLRDECVESLSERLIGIDPGYQGSLDLTVTPNRLEHQGFPVGELLPDGPQRHSGARGDPWDGRAQVTVSVQRAHRVEDRAASAVRAGRPAVRRLDVGRTQIRLVRRRTIDVHHVILW